MTAQANLIETTIAQAKEPPLNGSPPSEPAAGDSPEVSPVEAQIHNWRDTLPDNLKDTPSLAKFKDVESLAKSYLESEKAFSGRIAVPKEDASDADWEAFYRKIGRPEDKRYRPDGLTVSGEEEPLLARYEEILHASGLTKRQGQKMLSHMADLSASMEEEAKAREEAVRASNLAILEKAFDGQMDLRVNQIQAALTQFGRQDLAALVEQTNYNPALVQFLSSVGETLASDRLVTGDALPARPGSREAALEEIKRLENDEGFQVKYWSNDFEERQEPIKRMNELYKAACRQTSDI